ncbi:hypothetical protein VULLAG_LOCUS21447 [Vulpes lagopus]
MATQGYVLVLMTLRTGAVRTPASCQYWRHSFHRAQTSPRINGGKKPGDPINPVKPVIAAKLCPDKAFGG